MANNGKRKNGGQGPSGNPKPPAKPPRNIAVVIPQPFSVLKESSTEDNQQYAEERSSREAQLRTAQRLNSITIKGGVIAALSLLAVFLSLWQSRETSQEEQRAWVMVDYFKIDTALNTTQSVPIKFALKNFGKSPGIDVVSETHTWVAGDACPSKIVRSPYKSKAPIAPEVSQELDSLYIGALGQPCLDALTSGKASITYTGEISYWDIFHKKHLKEYCFQFEGERASQFTYCDAGNSVN